MSDAFCATCGAARPDGASFCPACGRRFDAPPVVVGGWSAGSMAAERPASSRSALPANLLLRALIGGVLAIVLWFVLLFVADLIIGRPATQFIGYGITLGLGAGAISMVGQGLGMHGWRQWALFIAVSVIEYVVFGVAVVLLVANR